MSIYRIIGAIRIILLFFFYSLLLLYAVTFNNSTGWMLSFFLTFLLIIDLISLIPSLKMIKVAPLEQTIYTVNQMSKLSLLLFRYKSALIPMTDLQIALKGLNRQQAHFLLYTGKQESLAFEWRPKKRGIFKELSLIIRCSDFLRIFRKQIIRQLPGPFIVMPELRQQEADRIAQAIFTLHPSFKSLVGDPTFVIRNFRTHQFGDALRMIDWKQSSKRNELIVKEYEHEIEQETFLIFYGQHHEHFERLLSLYYSFHNAVGKQRHFIPRVMADYPSDTDPEMLFAAATAFTDNRPLPDLINKKLILFAPAETADLQEQLQGLKQANELFLITFHQDELILKWKDQIISLEGADPHE